MRWPDDLPPASLTQPDGISCGPTAVVAARLLLSPSWRPDDIPGEIAAVHRSLTATLGPTGRSQLPWPRALGTPPWAVAGVLSDLTGASVTTRLARLSPAAGYDELVRRVQARPVAVYVGSAWLPRHVVLAFDAPVSGDSVRVLDPARGRLLTVPRGRWRLHELDVAGWSHLWFVV